MATQKVTVELPEPVIALRLNNETITEARALWIKSNWHPPAN
ncbi:hypothetical protein [Dulcicalothrix desertica]|nr:hypothetical protein [Dulcicalothrix desertica]